MKSIKTIALSAFVTLGAFFTVLYTSCTKDECKDVVCQHGGTCSNGSCVCPTGYIGTNCQTRALVGVWAGTDICTPSGTYNISITLANSSTDTAKMLITNPGGFGSSIVISGTVSADGKTITYPNQAISSTVSMGGSILLTDNTHFTHTYTASDLTGNTSCTGTYTKQ